MYKYVHDGDMTVRVHRLYRIERTVLAYNRQLKYTEHTDRSFTVFKKAQKIVICSPCPLHCVRHIFAIKKS